MFSTVFTIISLLFNFWTLLLIAVVLGVAALIYFVPFLGGPPKLISVALNPGTWIGIAGALCLIAFQQSIHTIEKQNQEIHQANVVNTSTGDGVAVLTDNDTKKVVAKQHVDRLQKAIDAAPAGDEEDAFWDQIHKEQCSDSANSSRPDCLHN